MKKSFWYYINIYFSLTHTQMEQQKFDCNQGVARSRLTTTVKIYKCVRSERLYSNTHQNTALHIGQILIYCTKINKAALCSFSYFRFGADGTEMCVLEKITDKNESFRIIARINCISDTISAVRNLMSCSMTFISSCALCLSTFAKSLL